MSEASSMRSAAEQPLAGKVTLLLGGASAGGRSLAVSLAELGADVAIVCHDEQTAQMEETKTAVEAAGRRCVVIPDPYINGTYSYKAVHKTIETLGRLDLFIDYSSLDRDEMAKNNAADSEADPVRGNRENALAHVDMLVAALNQIVGLEKMNTQEMPAELQEAWQRSKKRMRVAKELINKPIIGIEEGKQVGRVRGFFLDEELTRIQAVNLGSEGLFGGDEKLIMWSDVVTLGEDALLIKEAGCVLNRDKIEEGFENYLRRNEISGWRVDTSGGTKIGNIGDIIIDEEAKIVGFSLPQTYVPGPIADNQAINRSAIIDINRTDHVLIAVLAKAERTDIQVVYEGLFAEPVVSNGGT